MTYEFPVIVNKGISVFSISNRKQITFNSFLCVGRYVYTYVLQISRCIYYLFSLTLIYTLMHGFIEVIHAVTNNRSEMVENKYINACFKFVSSRDYLGDHQVSCKRHCGGSFINYSVYIYAPTYV